MGSKSKKALAIRAVSDKLKSDAIDAAVNLASNPAVETFTVSVDKRLGMIKTSATAADGRVSSTEIIGPGLTATMNFTPGDRASRDESIRMLRSVYGLSQVEIAKRTGVSQPLVSKILSGS